MEPSINSLPSALAEWPRDLFFLMACKYVIVNHTFKVAIRGVTLREILMMLFQKRIFHISVYKLNPFLVKILMTYT